MPVQVAEHAGGILGVRAQGEIRDMKYKTRDTRHEMQDTRHKTQDTRHKAQDTKG